MDFIQAKGTYHFSSDALLLADFANKLISKNIFSKKRNIHPPFLFLDLGCGCGIIGIQILKYIKEQYPEHIKHVHMLGIDKEAVLIESAKANAKAFGFEENYSTLQADLALCEKEVHDWALRKKAAAENGKLPKHGTKRNDVDKNHLEKNDTETEDTKNNGIEKNPRLFDAIVTNPPWYNKNKGRVSHEHLRREALFGDENSMQIFLTFAEKKLKKNASLYMVAKTGNFTDCIQAIPKNLRCTTMQNVHDTHNKNAIFFLLEARFQSKADMVFHPPLFLNTLIS